MPSYKTLILIAGTAALALAASFLTYFTQFHGAFASESSSWGEFGSYVGGVSAPLLAFASLIALLYTIHIQGAELRRSAQAAVRTAELQRLAGLLALHDHYQKHLANQGEIAKTLQGLSGQSQAFSRIADLDTKIREVTLAIEEFHRLCTKGN